MFNENSEANKAPGFIIFAFVILILANVLFLSEWLYLYLISLNFKNEALNVFLRFYGMILCKRHDSVEHAKKLSNFYIQIS